jgi:transposase InsO family protein
MSAWPEMSAEKEVQSDNRFEPQPAGSTEPSGPELRRGCSWVADITYIPTDEGWLYLAAIKDLCTCEIVGYDMAIRMTQDLVGRALFRAVTAKRPAKGLIHHSDRGSQYCFKSYRKLLRQFGILSSMSRKGNCWDNAPMESFFGILKTELVHHRHYGTRNEAIGEIRENIEIFYNRQRRHAKLGNLSPAAFQIQLLQDKSGLDMVSAVANSPQCKLCLRLRDVREGYHGRKEAEKNYYFQISEKNFMSIIL